MPPFERVSASGTAIAVAGSSVRRHAASRRIAKILCFIGTSSVFCHFYGGHASRRIEPEHQPRPAHKLLLRRLRQPLRELLRLLG